MGQCTEPGCERPGEWSEADQTDLCPDHFVDRFEADLLRFLNMNREQAKQPIPPPGWTPKWIRFQPLPVAAIRKTGQWAVRATADGVRLGVVSWEAPWRKYGFFPDPGTVFEQDCLRDIARFCEEQTKAHKAARAQAVQS